MINIKCLNKNRVFFFQVCWQGKLYQNFSEFLKHFFFYKQIKKIGVEGFSEKPSTPIVFNLLIFHRGGWDENLKIYLSWPYKDQNIILIMHPDLVL